VHVQLTQVGSRLFFTRPEREERDTAKSAVASALFHFLIVLALVLLTRTGVLIATGDLGVGTGIGTGVAGGGGGGGQDDVVSIMMAAADPEPPAAEELTVPAKVEPVLELSKVEEKPIEDVEIAVVDTTPPAPAAVAEPAPNPTGGIGTGERTGTGTGTGPGTGPGSGGGTGGGTGGGIGSGVGPGIGRGRVLPPSPEVLLVPPTAPGNVRGKAVLVRLSVDSTGVVRDVEIIPSTGNRKYDETLKRTALGWKFRAARNELNRPVAVLFEVTFTF
jgi:protein TonB